MRPLVCAMLCALTGLGMTCLTVGAAGSTSRQPNVSWSQHDAAVYVVSTLNLVRTENGHSLPRILTGHLGVARFDVYADLGNPNLYFVMLERQDETLFGALAYQMGWLKPRGVTPFSPRLGIHKAPRAVVEAYRSDSTQLIGSFASTLPA